MKRAIVLFPKFENQKIIDAIRETYDPLAGFIASHLTLVFPFDSDLSTEELRLHVEYALEGIKPFEIELRGITGDFHDGYLFLNVKKGNDSVIELHDALYSGVLRRFLFRQVTYCPHLTVGRVEPALDFGKALNELDHVDAQFRTVIDRVYVEDIDSTEHSAIECSVGLK